MKITNHDGLKLECRQIKSEMTYELRKKVLWPHIKNDNYSLEKDTDSDTFHLGVYFKKKIISVGTFVKEQNDKINFIKQYRLRAMATTNESRGIGAGKLLIEMSLNLLKKKEIHILWCSSRINALGFYQSLGMIEIPKLYFIKNIGYHKTMYIELEKWKK